MYIYTVLASPTCTTLIYTYTALSYTLIQHSKCSNYTSSLMYTNTALIHLSRTQKTHPPKPGQSPTADCSALQPCPLPPVRIIQKAHVKKTATVFLLSVQQPLSSPACAHYSKGTREEGSNSVFTFSSAAFVLSRLCAKLKRHTRRRQRQCFKFSSAAFVLRLGTVGPQSTR